MARSEWQPSLTTMSTILRLRGLPFAATSEDITAFFKDYDTKAVYLGLRNGCDNPALQSADGAAGASRCPATSSPQPAAPAAPAGRPSWRSLAPNFCRKPTGDCYTEFETAEAAAKALKEKQHEHMGSRYIE